jgi:hypothetical protein
MSSSTRNSAAAGSPRLLLEAVIELARERELRTLDLTSRPSRESAIRLYESVGFQRRDSMLMRNSCEVCRRKVEAPTSRCSPGFAVNQRQDGVEETKQLLLIDRRPPRVVRVPVDDDWFEESASTAGTAFDPCIARSTSNRVVDTGLRESEHVFVCIAKKNRLASGPSRKNRSSGLPGVKTAAVCDVP